MSATGDRTDQLLEALSVLGNGKYRTIRKVAEEAYGEDSGALKAWSYTGPQNLSSLGHIDLALDEVDLAVSEWSVAMPAICATSNNSATLTGRRGKAMLKILNREASSTGVRITALPRDEEVDGPYPTAYELNFENRGQLEQLCANVNRKLSNYGLRCTFKFSETLAGQLPSFDKILRALPEYPGLPPQQYYSWQINNSKNGQKTDEWSLVEPSVEDGLHRFQVGNSWRYAVSHQKKRYRVTNSVGKYLLSRLQRSPLISYEKDLQVLRCPWGARLPGLYERSAVLCSGTPPRKNHDGTLEYTKVSEEVASMIYQAIYGE